MSDTPSFQQLFDAGVSRAKQASLDAGLPITDFSEGSGADLALGAAAAMGELLVHKMTTDFRRFFFQTSKKADLDTLAYDRLRLTRAAATAAVVPVTLARPSSAAGAGTVPAGAVFATAQDPATGERITFTLDQAVGFGATDLSATGTATCTITGTKGQIAAAALTTIETSLFDGSITVTNPERSAGGNPEESDEALLVRCYTFATAQAKGTLGAIEFGAKTIPGVQRATALEELVAGLETGIIDLYIGDSQGYSNSALVAAVAAIMDDWRAGGATVNTIGMIVDQIAVVLTCTWEPGAATDANKAAVVEAVINEINSTAYQAGDTIYRPVLQQVALDAGRPLGLINAVATMAISPASPSAQDLTLTAGHVPKADTSLVRTA